MSKRDLLENESTPFVTLHLSDIHFGQEKGEDVEINRDARNMLARKVRDIADARAAAGRPPIGSIIITGDIAYSGKKKEFDEAVEWLAVVSNAAGSDPLSVQVVPGNHDVNRGSSPMVMGMLEQLFRYGKSRLATILGSEQDRNALYYRFKAYQEFANGYGCPLDQNGGNAGEKEHVLAPGLTLRIVGLNTALICCGKENNKKPKLMLGSRQRIIEEVDDVEYIVLMHHPLSWLRDGEDAQRYIDNRARILMCGHEHQPKVQEREVDGNGKLLIIDAGATVPDKVDEEYTYAFNVIEIDLTDQRDAIDVTVDTYRWKQTGKRFEQDTSEHEDGAPKVYRLPCPKFAAVVASAAAMVSAVTSGKTDDAGAGDEPVEPLEVKAEDPGAGGDAHRFATDRKSVV